MPSPPYGGAGKDSEPRGWRRFFAVSGIVFGFFFFLTIPGWIALRTYRQWKSGERGQPNVLIAWGIVSFTLFWTAFAVGLVALPIQVREVDPLEGLTGTTGASAPVTEVPPGVTASALDSGWTRYSSDAEGFSIALPPSWQTTTVGDTGPDVKLAAVNTDPSYLDGIPPELLITTNPVNLGTYAPLYYKAVLLRVAKNPRTVGTPQMTTTRLPDGLAYVISIVDKSSRGRTSYTRYGLLKYTTEYVLLFIVPIRHADEYRDSFDLIAKTLETGSQ